MLVYVRGAGDIATGIALRLHRAGCGVVMSDIAKPTCVRRNVSFCEAIRLGACEVEGVRAVLARDAAEALAAVRAGRVAVCVDPDARLRTQLAPGALVDAILAKRNLGTRITDAPVVIGVGPGFTAPVDCHAAVETKRGHFLGRAIYEGSPAPNTGVPGTIGGVTTDRVLRAPAAGPFEPICELGDLVRAGQEVARVDGRPVITKIDGCLRGLLAPGIECFPGMKAGDVDPRGQRSYTDFASDKATAVGGGVLEAICRFSGALA